VILSHGGHAGWIPEDVPSCEMRLRVLPLTLVVLLTAQPALAYRPEDTPRRRLKSATDDARAHRATSGATLGMVVLREGVPIMRINEGAAMIPASLTKLATTVAAIHRFGPEHRMPTIVRASGGTAQRPQTLIMVGRGDPTFSTEAYRRKRYLPDPDDRIQRPVFASGSPTVEQLAAKVEAAGIRSVAGDLIADESWFDTDRVPDGWPARYFSGEPESGYHSALVINEGRTDLTRKQIHPRPALQAANTLRSALKSRGITIGGTVRIGRTPSGSREVARVSSPPMSEIVDFINRYSANFQADMVFKALGARYGNRGSYAEGERIVVASLRAFGISTGRLDLRDGSGLSRSGRLTATTIAQTLEAIRTRPALKAVWDSLPVAGGPGTLERRLNRWPTRGNLRAKTGLLREVRGLAGVVRDRDGAQIVYASMYNRGRSAIALGVPLDLLTLAFAYHPLGR
jgi:serine-type D-Ala-D-Ala carboxypeptidase/endopeptidase (penicillin-binding protein 4)